MRLLIVIALSLFGVHGTFAQIGISIAPLLNTKFQFCNYGGDTRFNGYSEYENIGHQNPFYTFNAKRMINPYSVYFGMRLRADIQKKHILMLEWSSDETGTMSKESSFSSEVNNSSNIGEVAAFGHGTSYDRTNFSFNRISLVYGFQVIEEPRYLELYLLGDFSFRFGRAKQEKIYFWGNPLSELVYYHNNATFDSKKIGSWYWGGLSTSIGLGCKLDVNANIKNKLVHLFSTEVMYRQGLSYVVYSLHETTIQNNGNKVRFLNELSSRGSGIYFQISRRFSLSRKRISNSFKV